MDSVEVRKLLGFPVEEKPAREEAAKNAPQESAQLPADEATPAPEPSTGQEPPAIAPGSA
jgi:hypothetical protein